MDSGYVKLWRKSLESPTFQNANVWRFWTWCLLKATHKPFTAFVGYQKVDLEPGQFVFGINKSCIETGLSPQQTRTSIMLLKKLENLTIKSTNKFSVITIINWDTYQGEKIKTNKQPNKQATSKQQAGNNIQTHKHINTSTKTLYSECVFLSESEYQKLALQYGPNLTDKAIKILSDYIMSSGKKYKSHYHTIIRWPIERAKENGNAQTSVQRFGVRREPELSGEAERAIQEVKRLERERAIKASSIDNA